MLRPGLHFHNQCGITLADMDLISRWSPLSLLEAMENVVESQTELVRDAWELACQPPLVLRRYYAPRKGGPAAWGAHALESVSLAVRCLDAGIPLEKLMLKPFNEPNMPHWANWEGFGDTEDDMKRYNEALLTFMEVARGQLPGIAIGGPHVTVGNRDVRFPNDPPGVYYYHGADMRFESSPCHEALSALDVHFVHCYGMHPGQYRDRAHGLRFLEYEKYLPGKDIYVVEGAYGINSGQPADQNTVRGEETAAYLKLLGEEYPQVKGIALWIGGDPGAGWFSFCHSNGSVPDSHRPVVYAVEAACGGATPEPLPDPSPEPSTLDWDGLSEEMKQTVRVFPARQPHVEHWRAARLEVQPEADNMSLFAIFPAGTPATVRFSWPEGEVLLAPRADPLAPEGAREWAASMPMFEPWGAYAVDVVGNSERVEGLGLCGAGLEVGYKGHHPVLVHFQRAPGQSAELSPQLPEPPSPIPPEEDAYTLLKAFPRAGLENVVDLRDEIESFSDMAALDKLWRPFKLIRLVVIHHSGSDLALQTPLSVARYRVLDRGDPTIPYHFCIGFDGRLFFTARLCWRLPHSGKAATNAEGVSVCLLGHYGKQQPSAAQLETLRRLVWWILPEFLGGGWGRHRGLYVIPHGRLVATECPGENLVDALVWEGEWSFATAPAEHTQDVPMLPFRRQPPGE